MKQKYCQCGGSLDLLYDCEHPEKYKDVKVDGAYAFFWTKCPKGHWHYAPMFDGIIHTDLCEACDLMAESKRLMKQADIEPLIEEDEIRLIEAFRKKI